MRLVRRHLYFVVYRIKRGDSLGHAFEHAVHFSVVSSAFIVPTSSRTVYQVQYLARQRGGIEAGNLAYCCSFLAAILNARPRQLSLSLSEMYVARSGVSKQGVSHRLIVDSSLSRVGRAYASVVPGPFFEQGPGWLASICLTQWYLMARFYLGRQPLCEYLSRVVHFIVHASASRFSPV